MPGKIIEIRQAEDPLDRTGRVDFGGVIREVNLACVPQAKLGDFVIVHVGLAISVLDEEEARRTLETFRELADAAAAGNSG